MPRTPTRASATASPALASHGPDRVDTLYGEPELYDILHAPDTPWEVQGLFKIARRFLGPRKPESMRWLEPACGSGRYLRLAAKKGVRVVGFDRAPAMIDYARARMKELGASRRATLFVGDMVGFETEFKPSSIDMAFNLINTIRHLPSDRDMIAHFRGLASVLKPRGVAIVGISLSSYGNELPDEDVWRAKRGRTEITQIASYIPAPGGKGASGRTERVHSHLMVRTPAGVSHHDDSYGLRAYDLKQWRSIIARAGFHTIATIDEHGEDHPVREPGYALHVLQPREPQR
jgi:SAM-dependent methyltransferase